MGQAVGLPLAFLTMLLLARLERRRRAPRMPRATVIGWRPRQPRLAFLSVGVVTLAYAFAGPAAGQAVITASADSTARRANGITHCT